jgi:hypothetical protein
MRSDPLRALVMLAVSSFWSGCTCSRTETLIAEDSENGVSWVRVQKSGLSVECAGGHGFGFCLPTSEQSVHTVIRTPDDSFPVSFSCFDEAAIVAEPSMKRFAMRCKTEKWALLIRGSKKSLLWGDAFEELPEWSEVPPLHEVAHLVWQSTPDQAALIDELRATRGEAGLVDLLVATAGMEGDAWTTAYQTLSETDQQTAAAALEKHLRGSPVSSPGVVRRAFDALVPSKHEDRIPAFTRHLDSMPEDAHPEIDALIGLLSHTDPDTASKLACSRAATHCAAGCQLALAVSSAPCSALAERIDATRCAPALLCDQGVCPRAALDEYARGVFASLAPGADPPLRDPKLTLLAAERRGLAGPMHRSIERGRYSTDPVALSCGDAMQSGEPCRCDDDELAENVCQAKHNEATTTFCDVAIDDDRRRLRATSRFSAHAVRLSHGDQLCLEMKDTTIRCMPRWTSARATRVLTDTALYGAGIVLGPEGASAGSGALDLPASPAPLDAARDLGVVAFTAAGGTVHARFDKGGRSEHRFDALTGWAVAHGTVCVLDAGRLQCWGPGTKGVLGAPYEAPHDLGAYEAVTGQRHAICARSDAKRATCWKNGKRFELAWPLASAFAGSARFLCGTDDGRVQCADLNLDAPRTEPVEMPEPVTAVDVHDNHLCALASSGRVYCWNGKGAAARLTWSGEAAGP